MKVLFGWIILIVLILTGFYYINQNLEKTVLLHEFLKLDENPDKIVYSAKAKELENNVITFDIFKDSEVVVLSESNLSRANKTIKINVDKPGKNIILVLLSKQKVIWDVSLGDDTNINLVVFNNQESKVVSKSKFYKKYEELVYLENLENLDFLHFAKYLKNSYSQNRVSYFYKQINDETIIVNENKSENKIVAKLAQSNKVQSEVDFELLSEKLDFIKFNLYGPLDSSYSNTKIKKKVSFNPSKSKVYEVLDDGIKIINIDTKEESINKIPVGRKIFNSKGIAYDRLSDRVFVSGKYGKFYIFDAVDEKWLSIRKYIEDFDINSLSYDLISNIYLSSTWKNEGLLLFDQNGNFVKRVDLENRLEGLSYYYDKETQEVPQLYVVAQGNDIALVLIRDFVEQIWLYEKSKDLVTLTYNYYDS